MQAIPVVVSTEAAEQIFVVEGYPETHGTTARTAPFGSPLTEERA